jgi:hypothetical protein
MTPSPTRSWRAPKSVLAALAVTLILPVASLIGDSPASAAPSFTTTQLVAPGGAAEDIAVVSTSSLREEVFFVPPNGSVQERYFVQGVGWKSAQVAPPSSADPWSDVAAVTRVRNAVNQSVDVFWVGPNGSIEHAYNQSGLPWLREPTVAPPGSASSGTSLAAVSRAPFTWEIFWVGPSGEVHDAYWYDGGPSGRFVLAPASSSTPAFLPRQLSVVSRASNTMELFWIGRDGSIQDRYFYDGAGWNGFTLGPPGSASTSLSPGGQISAVSKASNTMEVWWIGRDNSVQDRYYFDGSGWNGFTLSGPNSAWSALASVAPSSASMDVFWRGWGSNSVQLAYFGPPWAQMQVGPAGPFAGGGIAAVSRTSSHLDVFYLTWNGAIAEAAS